MCFLCDAFAVFNLFELHVLYERCYPEIIIIIIISECDT